VKVRNLKWKASFAVLLLSTALFIAYAVAASKAELEKPKVVTGLYASVIPVELDDWPELGTYVVLNYSYKSDIPEVDLIHALENYDSYAEGLKQQYEKGEISEELYNHFMFDVGAANGRITDKILKAFKDFNVTWERFYNGGTAALTIYIYWQPENRWFKMTETMCIDAKPFGEAENFPLANIAFGSVMISVGWIGWIALFTKQANVG